MQPWHNNPSFPAAGVHDGKAPPPCYSVAHGSGRPPTEQSAGLPLPACCDCAAGRTEWGKTLPPSTNSSHSAEQFSDGHNPAKIPGRTCSVLSEAAISFPAPDWQNSSDEEPKASGLARTAEAQPMNCRWEPPVHRHNMPRRNGGKQVPSPPAPASCECEVRRPVSQSYYAPSGQYLLAGNASRRSHAISRPVLLALHTNDTGGKHTDNIPRPVSLRPQSLSSPCHGNECQWLPGHSPAHSYKKESAKSLTTVLRPVHYLSCIRRSTVPKNS